MTDDFARWLATQLRSRRWSQRELARRAGLSHTAIYYVLHGKHPPSPSLCLAIASPLGVPDEELLRRAGHLPGHPQPASFAPEIVHRLDQIARELPRFEPCAQRAIAGLFLDLVDLALELKGIDPSEQVPGTLRAARS